MRTNIKSNSKKKVAKGLNRKVTELLENISFTFSDEPKINFSIATLIRAPKLATKAEASTIFLLETLRDLIISATEAGLIKVSKYNL